MRLQSSVTGDSLYWEAEGTDGRDAETSVLSFLRLGDVDLPALADEWSGVDSHFAEVWAAHPGVRILRQDPDECFFSFLCASVAPIARIRGMLTAVVRECPAPPGAEGYFPFPAARAIATVPESRLRELGLGFRAVRVAEAARILAALPTSPLPALRYATHEEARRFLTTFPGVGTKIADCICLFSLDKDGAVPVDTHIWRISQTRYAPDLAGKSLTPANYDRAVAAFHDRFGPYAGWAQQILFYRAAVGSRQRGKVDERALMP